MYPIFGGAVSVSLPAVSLDKEPVSARALFGDAEDYSKKPEPIAETKSSRTVVSRSEPVEVVERLMPKKVSSDIWVKGDGMISKNKNSDATKLAWKKVDMGGVELPEEFLELNPKQVSKKVESKLALIKPSGVSDITVAASLPKVGVRSVQKPAMDDETLSMIKSAKYVDAANKKVAFPEVEAPIKTVSAAPITTVNVATPSVIRSMKQAKDSTKVASVETRPILSVIEDTKEKVFEKKDTGSLADLSPSQLKKAFYKTYVSENKHLSAYADFDTASSMTDAYEYVETEGFVGQDVISSSSAIQPRPLEIKISFKDDDSSLSRENFQLLSEYAVMMSSNPKKAIQIAISEEETKSYEGRKLAARRLAIIEQVLRDSGVAEQRIMPVLSARTDDAFVLRIISQDQFKSLVQQRKDMFGDNVSKKSSRSLSW